MPGLNNFRGGAAAPTAPTSYNATYATTAQDARDKCEGNEVASVTRTATSTTSFIDALTKATAAAKAAIVCPVFTASYTTTPADSQAICQGNTAAAVTRTATSGKNQATALAAATAAAKAAIACPVFTASYTTNAEDYRAKCGANTSGASVTGYGSSGKNQATADAAAYQDAISRIVCPVPPPSFAQVLNPGDNVQTLTFDASSSGKVRYNNPVQAEATAPGAGAMSIFFPNLSTQVGYLNFDPADAGHPMAYELNGVLYYKNASTGNGLTFTDGSVLLGN